MDSVKLALDTHMDCILSGIKNEELKDLIRYKTYFAGGCVRDLCRNKLPKDYDVWFIDEKSKNRFIELAGTELLIKTKINNYNQINTNTQFITLVSGNPDTVVKQFDFNINMGYYIPHLQILKIPDVGMNLKVGENVASPMNTLVRLKKFIEAGYRIEEEDLIKLGIQLTKMKPIETQDQLEAALRGLSARINLNRTITGILTIPFPFRM